MVLVAEGLQGQLGRITSWMDGDFQYHRAVAFSIAHGHLWGQGPYLGLPSYLTGLYHYLLALAAVALGTWPDRVISVVSWFEPAMWAGAAWYAASRFWRQPGPRLAFVALVLFGAGLGRGPTAGVGFVWVDAATTAGHVFWPLFPRDIALILTLVALAGAMRGRPLLAGVLAGLTVGVHPQIGLVATALGMLTLGQVGRKPFQAVWRAAAAAAIVSSWYWVPRLLWTIQFHGFHLENFRPQLTFGPMVLWWAYGVFGPLAVAAWVMARRRRSHVTMIATSWFVLLVGLAILGVLIPTAVLPLRRALLLLWLPIAVIIVDGFAPQLTRPLHTSSGFIVMLAIVLLGVASWPQLLASRSLVDRVWHEPRYGKLAYPPARWMPVLSQLENTEQTLAPESDAPVIWFLTGTPVTWMKRPGFVKVGYPVGRATGWSETDRQREVNRAFELGVPALCDLAIRRGIEQLIFRSDEGLIATHDVAPAWRHRETRDAGYRDLNKYDTVSLESDRPVTVPFRGWIDRLDLWVTGWSPSIAVTVVTHDGVRAVAHDAGPDGSSRRLTVELHVRGPFDVYANGPVDLMRAAGYETMQGAEPPATALSRNELCHR